MEIYTTRFGTIPIQKEKVIHMPCGMIGFPDARRFVILPHKENSPFFWYQSLDDPALAYVITNPFLFKPDYTISLKDTPEAFSWNENGENKERVLYVIVNIPKGMPERMTANFIGPLVINIRTRQSAQVVIPNSAYSHRFPLLADAPQKT